MFIYINVTTIKCKLLRMSTALLCWVCNKHSHTAPSIAGYYLEDAFKIENTIRKVMEWSMNLEQEASHQPTTHSSL